MFLKFFGLREQPFGVTPDPRFLYLSPAHREALASLYYGIETGRGFLALIAKPGMGKTTLLFHLLEKFRTTAKTAFLFQTQCTSREFMRFLLAELGYETRDHDFVRMHEEFNKHLLQEARAGHRFIVVVDEAQRRDPDAWASLIAEHRVTVLHFMPGWLEMLVEVGAGQLSSVRVVPAWPRATLAGEASLSLASARTTAKGE